MDRRFADLDPEQFCRLPPAEQRLAFRALRAEADELLMRLTAHEADDLAMERAIPRCWQLTPAERRLFVRLLDREVVSKESARLATGTSNDKTIDVFICHLRRKLRARGVAIATLYGQGWRLEDRRAWRRRLLDGAADIAGHDGTRSGRCGAAAMVHT